MVEKCDNTEVLTKHHASSLGYPFSLISVSKFIWYLRRHCSLLACVFEEMRITSSSNTQYTVNHLRLIIIFSNSIITKNQAGTMMNFKASILFLILAQNVASFSPSQLKIPDIKTIAKDVSNVAKATVLSSLLLANTMSPMLPGGEANAMESRLVGEIAGSGIVFKDTLNIESFDDPKVKGVTLYISNFQRPLNERLSKDFFNDPSFASVACAKTGPISIADNIAVGKQGEEVFEENRSLLFKQLKVQRIYDKEKNTVIYASFNTRLDKKSDTNKSRFKSSVCAVNLN